ncbi:MAG: nuclear transport factor 2 family protein [Proteobacteria bacterium]|nr:nuclear transport factor 2 family protein [Pseudomonadota bacterium]
MLLLKLSPPGALSPAKIRSVVFFAAAVLALTFAGCAPAPEPDPVVMQIRDRLAVQDTVVEFFRASDVKDWRRARVVFTEKVHCDLPDLFGPGSSERPAQEFMDAWSGRLETFDAIHHQVGNFGTTVLEFGAYVTCYVTAAYDHPEREKGPAFHMGSYDFHLVRREDGWRIDAIRYHSRVVGTVGSGPAF